MYGGKGVLLTQLYSISTHRAELGGAKQGVGEPVSTSAMKSSFLETADAYSLMAMMKSEAFLKPDETEEEC